MSCFERAGLRLERCVDLALPQRSMEDAHGFGTLAVEQVLEREARLRECEPPSDVRAVLSRRLLAAIETFQANNQRLGAAILLFRK